MLKSHTLLNVYLRAGLLVAGLVVVLAALSGRLARNLSYNIYELLTANYLRNDCVEAQAMSFSRPYRWLRRSADLGDERARRQLAYLSQHVGSELPAGDRLALGLAIRGWHSQRLGHQLPASVWKLLRTGSARIEAEEMMIAGAAVPNPYAVVKTEADRTFVVLYWHHNHLQTLVAVPTTGPYKVTVMANDWRAPPTRLRVRIGDASDTLTWEAGDHVWRERTALFHLAKGVATVEVSFLAEPGDDPLSDGLIDYLKLERISER